MRHFLFLLILGFGCSSDEATNAKNNANNQNDANNRNNIGDSGENNEDMFVSPQGYVGFGAVTQGAASCPTPAETYNVTTLSGGSETGSFRDAVSSGCRLIVFDIGGEINLGDLQISESYLTIDGSSAPSPGITLRVNRLALEARADTDVHDIIVNNIRTLGQGGDVEGDEHWELDGSSGAPIYNIVLDHLTMDGASDGSVDIYGDVHDITLSNSLSKDTVKVHHFSQAEGLRERLTIYKNVYARCNERQPRIRYNTRQIDYVNNVIYGWGWFEGGAAGMHIDIGGAAYSPSANVENNVYLFVGGQQGDSDDGLRIEGNLDGTWHFAGNVWPAGEQTGDQASNSDRVSMNGMEVPRSSVDELDVSNAGTHFPTAEESQLLADITAAL